MKKLFALFAVVSAGLGLAGFALALVDLRGQTLHDKLSGAIVVPSGARFAGLPPGARAP